MLKRNLRDSIQRNLTSQPAANTNIAKGNQNIMRNVTNLAHVITDNVYNLRENDRRESNG